MKPAIEEEGKPFTENKENKATNEQIFDLNSGQFTHKSEQDKVLHMKDPRVIFKLLGNTPDIKIDQILMMEEPVPTRDLKKEELEEENFIEK